MPSKYIQDAMIQQITAYSTDRNISILDVSCGDGIILKRLKQLGYTNITGTIYGNDKEIYDYSAVDYSDITIVRNVNLLEKLPFETQSFDVVINTELLTHLENHRNAMAELCRIVKKGGILVFETPNISRLQSRFNFFLTGFHKPRNPLPGYHRPLIEHVLYHSFPVHLPLIDYFCYQFGFELKSISWNKIRLFPIVLLILLYPLILLNTILFLMHEKLIDNKTKIHLFKLMMHPAIQICSALILTYRKKNDAVN